MYLHSPKKVFKFSFASNPNCTNNIFVNKIHTFKISAEIIITFITYLYVSVFVCTFKQVE